VGWGRAGTCPDRPVSREKKRVREESTEKELTKWLFASKHSNLAVSKGCGAKETTYKNETNDRPKHDG
jgi:hypothetical protein